MNTTKIVPPFVKSAIERLQNLIAQVEAKPLNFSNYIAFSSGGNYPLNAKFYDDLDIRLLQAIRDISPNHEAYNRCKEAQTTDGKARIASALLNDLQDGYFNSLSAFAHADVFNDLLEEAFYLNSEGFNVAATVIAGSVAESHLRQLALLNSIDVEDCKGKPKKASILNEDLAKVQVYDLSAKKQVIAWQGLRNDAAHGKKTNDEMDTRDVTRMIDGIRDFCAKYPA